MSTEKVDGGLELGVHPHCLTGAKGLETSVQIYDFDDLRDDEDEDFENLIANDQYEELMHRDSDQLLRLSELSSESTGVCKLALDTEEDEVEEAPAIHLLPPKNDENSTSSIRFSAMNPVILSSEFSLRKKPSMKYVDSSNQNFNFMNSITGQSTSQYELDSILMQSPEKEFGGKESK